jgi:hypothetical protein
MQRYWKYMPEDEYNSRRDLWETAHSFQTFRKCPFMYRKAKDGEKPKDSAVFAFGRAAHTLILEGQDKYNASYAIGGPINEKTGKPYGVDTQAYSKWASEQGKPVLSNDQNAVLMSMASSVLEHQMASALLRHDDDTAVEAVVEAMELYGHPFQSRIDMIRAEGTAFIDLKTCANLDKFEYDAREYGYIEQMAAYRDVCRSNNASIKEVHIVAVEKQEPYRVGVWLILPESLDKASEINKQTGNELLECIDLDEWPTRYEQVRMLGLR